MTRNIPDYAHDPCAPRHPRGQRLTENRSGQRETALRPQMGTTTRWERSYLTGPPVRYRLLADRVHLVYTVALIVSWRLFPLKLSWFASQLPDLQGSLKGGWLHVPHTLGAWWAVSAGSSHYTFFVARSASCSEQGH